MIYIAFLQGINVGKHNKIRMDDLKRMFESMGLKKIKTYLQNGNVIFESNKAEATLRKMIEREIMIIYRYVVPVVLRTLDDLKELINDIPFSKAETKSAESSSGEGLYLGFLKQNPLKDKAKNINQYIEHGDQLHIIGRNIYMLFPNQTIRCSKLVRNLYRLDIHVCVRKLYTVKRLIKFGNEFK